VLAELSVALKAKFLEGRQLTVVQKPGGDRGFDFYRAFAADARDNAEHAQGPPTATPVLYIRGGACPFDIEPYAAGLRIAGVEQVTTAVMADVGHFIADEAPDDLWRLITDFSLR
jgi:pimeloyl-ACP methyl ester carboxylesterase